MNKHKLSPPETSARGRWPIARLFNQMKAIFPLKPQMPSILVGTWRALFVALAGIALLIGLYARSSEYKKTVTYIDELLVLSEGGYSDIMRPKVDRDGPLTYLYRSMLNKESSYPPLPFIIAQLVKGKDQTFSLTTLYNSRLAQILISSLGLLILFILTKIARKNASPLDWPAAFILSCLALNESLIFNSQQITPYIFGIFGVPASLWLFIKAIESKNQRGRGFCFFLISLLTLGHFLMIFVQASLITTYGLIYFANDKTKSYVRRILNLFREMLWLTPSLAILASFSIFLYTQKSELSIPWWIQTFVSSPDQTLKNLLLHLYGVYAESFRIFSSREILIHWLASFSLITTFAGTLSIVLKRGKIEIESRNLLYIFFASVSILVFFIIVYLLQRIPLSPTRHNLILIPIFYLLFYCSLEYLRLKWVHQKRLKNFALRLICLIFMLLSIWHTSLNFSTNLIKKRETWDAGLILSLAKDRGAKYVVSSLWDYSKLQLFLGVSCLDGSFTCMAVVNSNSIPKASILVGQAVHIFPSIYNGPHAQEKILTLETNFDFEPYPGINYWPNSLHVWHTSNE